MLTLLDDRVESRRLQIPRTSNRCRHRVRDTTAAVSAVAFRARFDFADDLNRSGSSNGLGQVAVQQDRQHRHRPAQSEPDARSLPFHTNMIPMLLRNTCPDR